MAATAGASLRVGRTAGVGEHPPTRPFGGHAERMDFISEDSENLNATPSWPNA